jgi:hypothetical protein
MALLGDGVLAVAKGVPQLDGSVAGAGHDLPVVCREGNGEDVVGVADKAPRGGASRQLPETQRLIPGRREGVRAVRRNDLLTPSV